MKPLSAIFQGMSPPRLRTENFMSTPLPTSERNEDVSARIVLVGVFGFRVAIE
jgi:hypothetical protein